MTIKIKKSRPVSIGAFIRAIDRVKANPTAVFNRSFIQDKPKSGKEIHQEYLHCLHSRITEGRSLGSFINP